VAQPAPALLTPQASWTGLSRFYVTGRVFVGLGGSYMSPSLSEPELVSVDRLVFLGIQIGYELIHRSGFNLGIESAFHFDFEDISLWNGELFSLRLGYAREFFSVDIALGWGGGGLSFGPVARSSTRVSRPLLNSRFDFTQI